MNTLSRKVGLALALCVTSIFAGCGKHVDPELQPIVDEFYAEAGSRGVHPEPFDGSVEFVDDVKEDGRQAECIKPSSLSLLHRRMSIAVKRAFWDAADERFRRWVVFHELGHCVLGREHTENTGRLEWIKTGSKPLIASLNGARASIMSTQGNFPEIADWPQVKGLYLDELFLRADLFSGNESRRQIVHDWWKKFLGDLPTRLREDAAHHGHDISIETLQKIDIDDDEIPTSEFRGISAQALINNLHMVQGDEADWIEPIAYALLGVQLGFNSGKNSEIESVDGVAYPKSITNLPRVEFISDFPKYYRAHREAYLTELFGDSPKPASITAQ